MDATALDFLEKVIGPLIGAGAGSYFGLKSALNGIRQTTRDTLRELQEHRRDIPRAHAQMAEQIRRDLERLRDDG
jgi:hypothetical protein